MILIEPVIQNMTQMLKYQENPKEYAWKRSKTVLLTSRKGTVFFLLVAKC